MMYLLCLLSALFVGSYSATDSSKLLVHITTWNVNQKSPPKDLKPLLGLKRHPDVIAVGLQEVVVLPHKAIKNAIYEDEWTKALDETVTGNGYTKVQKVAMVGLVLNVYVQNRHNTTLSATNYTRVRTGCMGLYGNKGGVALTLPLYGSTITFVVAHLPPKDGALAKRIDDFHIIDKLKGRSCEQEDITLWIGDFNFRLYDESLNADRIHQLIEMGNLRELLAKDQLNDVRASDKAFKGYDEYTINFKPTYRYTVGTNDYDLKRRPAWTDRVLYRATKPGKIIPVLYNVVPNFDISDHKPVEAVFQVVV